MLAPSSRLRAKEPGGVKKSPARWPASFLLLLLLRRRLPWGCRACARGRRGGDPGRTELSLPRTVSRPGSGGERGRALPPPGPALPPLPAAGSGPPGPRSRAAKVGAGGAQPRPPFPQGLCQLLQKSLSLCWPGSL